MPLVCLSGNAEVLKDEYVKNMCEREKLRRIALDSTQVEKAINMVRQADFLISNCLLDVVDFDDWKKADKEAFLHEAAKNDTMKIVVRALQPLKNVETVVLELPKPWQEDEWLEYARKRFESRGLNVDEKALKKFLKFTDHNDLAMEREIEKLTNVTQLVSEELVEKVVFDYSKAQIDEFCFAVSSLERKTAFELVAKCLMEYEPVLVCASLAKHFVDLYRISVLVPLKNEYSWPEVKNYSTNLSITASKVARFLGFKFKGQIEKTVNHLQLYTPEKIEQVLFRLQMLDFEIKSTARGLLNFQVFLDWFFSFMEVQP